MLEVVALSIILTRQPISRTTEEGQIDLCFDSTELGIEVEETECSYTMVSSSSDQITAEVNGVSIPDDSARLGFAERFNRFASEWKESTQHLSSITSAVSHPSYQEIIRLGWDVVPILLSDLKKNEGFWFPALNAITGIRPFDRKDAGNSKKMTKAWLDWGQKKGLV